ncbi:MAG: M1 family aminopeptidase, partial [Planctomycetota bacterium]
RFRNDGEHLEVFFSEVLQQGERVSLEIAYSVDNPSSGLHFFGPTEDEPDIPTLVWSQGQSVDNSHWFPCFDHPNERQTTELVVTTRRGYRVSSNGRLLSERENQDTVTFHWLQDKPHVAYLVSLIVGEFHVTRDTWRNIPVEYWVHPKFKENVPRTFRNTIPMLEFFSNSIGVEYPWDRYAQICCEGFGGGMENTAATTLGNWSLHDERSSLDGSSDGLIAHELAHQWFGDLLTCNDWAHIWLNEGFASYFEALWAEENLGAEEFSYNMYRKASRARRGGKTRPVVDHAYEHPDSMFDSRAYPKGAWVLHMIRRRLGDEEFWEVLGRYTRDHAYGTVETVDLRRAIEQVTGRSFGRFFYDWTARPGHPELTVSFKWQNQEQLARVSVRQTQESAAFHFQLRMEFRFADAPLVSITRDITEKEMTFLLPLPEAPSLFRVDPEQAVLMELSEKKGRDLWKAQLLEDPSAAARVHAAVHFGKSRSDADRKLLAGALQEESFWGVQSEIAKALAESGGDMARDALLTGVKLQNPKARIACVRALGSFHHDPKVMDALRPLVVDGDPSYRVEAAAVTSYSKLDAQDALAVLKVALGRDSRFESVRGAALSGLGHVRDPEVVPLLSRWTRRDRPRFCRPKAISALATLTKRTHLEDATAQKIVATIRPCLDDSGRRIRLAAVRALGGLQDPG